MTASTSTPDSTRTVERPDGPPVAACLACAHGLADHDPIGARFCRATSAGALSRGCICRH